jgi:uncharacterized protein (DUF2235 family)
VGKRVVVCCDGTWNTVSQTCPTNVARLYEAIADVGTDGVEQHAYYHPGVGTSPEERIRGGAFGFGLSRNVQDCYRFIVDAYNEGDEIWFFGFSRGAFTARSTAGFVRNAGILRREYASRVGQAYDLYRNKDHPDAPDAVAFRRAFSVSVETPIRFIGVWDTVGALGIPNVGFPGAAWLNRRRWGFHDTQLSSKVQAAFQALAIDEHRRPFTPTLWDPVPAVDGQRVEQVWFTGCHCDVGGGYPEGALAEIGYYWMTDRARSCGLALKAGAVPLQLDCCTGKLHDSRTGLYKLLPPYYRKIGQPGPTHQSVASTAVQRTKWTPPDPTTKWTPYDPPNLRGPYEEIQI